MLEIQNTVKRLMPGACMTKMTIQSTLVITTAIFPIFYNSVTTSVSGSDIVNFFGLEIVNSVLTHILFHSHFLY